MPTIFITGTDTGVGKTTVASLLVSEWCRQGLNVRVCKPVETGCRLGNGGELIAEDGERLWIASERKQKLSDVTPYRFENPVSPNVASALEGRPINLDQLVSHVRAQSNDCDLFVVEGAGGLLVPIEQSFTFADFVREIEANVIVVVGSRLGVLNHASLTFEVLNERNLPVLGYIFNEPRILPPESVALQTNRKSLQEIAQRYEIPELGNLEFEKFSGIEEICRRTFEQLNS